MDGWLHQGMYCLCYVILGAKYVLACVVSVDDRRILNDTHFVTLPRSQANKVGLNGNEHAEDVIRAGTQVHSAAAATAQAPTFFLP